MKDNSITSSSKNHDTDKSLAIIISGDQWAGAAVQVYNAITALKQIGHNNLVVVILNEGELKLRLELLEVPIVLLDETKLSGFELIRRLSRFIRSEKPSIIHLHEYKAQILTSIAVIFSGFKGPLIRTVHSRLAPPAGRDQKRMRLFQYLDKLSIGHFSTGVIAVSQEIADSLSALSCRTPFWTIHNGISILPPDQYEDRQTVRDRFGIGNNTIWIGSAIRLESVKNPLMLIKSASILKEKGLSFKISIFGEGSLAGNLETEIRQCNLDDYVLLHGHSPNVNKLMHAWDIFTLTSHHEGIPMSLLEAMSAGVVPVCTAVGGIPEVIEDSNSGVLVANDDEFALSREIEKLIQNDELRQSIAKNAQSRIENNFNATDLAWKYESIYKILTSEEESNSLEGPQS